MIYHHTFQETFLNYTILMRKVDFWSSFISKLNEQNLSFNFSNQNINRECSFSEILLKNYLSIYDKTRDFLRVF